MSESNEPDKDNEWGHGQPPMEALGSAMANVVNVIALAGMVVLAGLMVVTATGVAADVARELARGRCKCD